MNGMFSLQSMYSYVMRGGKPAATGPLVCVVAMQGILRQSSASNPSQERSTINLRRYQKHIDAAFAAKGVQAVALDINCPGGSPAQCEMLSAYLRHKADSTKVPLYAFANDVAASGGYWIMCAADELYACRTSIVGSIGVVGNSFGFVEAMKRLGVERRIAAAGDSKVGADPFSELTEERAARQAEIMASLHDSFKDYVRSRRAGKLLAADEDVTFSGRVWTGGDAVTHGLTDGIGDLQSVLRSKVGADVRFRVFGRPQQPWWMAGARRSWWGLGAAGLLGQGGSVREVVEEVVQVFEDKAMWTRYGQ